MYQNLLIVDDEYDVLSWLEELFKFQFDEEIGVYTAATAAEALKLLDQVKFDVVLTDIHIPGMSGIELFERIKDNWPRCKTVFLTGYRSFEDMRTLLRHKDVRLVLKTEEDEVIMAAVREALAEVRQELEIVPLRKGRKEQIGEYLMRQEFMNNLLKGQVTSGAMLRECAERFQIPVDLSASFLLFLLRMDAPDSGAQEPADAPEIIAGLLRENMPEDIRFFLYETEDRTAVLLIQANGGREQKWGRTFVVALGAVEYAQITFRQKYAVSFSAVAGSTPIGYAEIRNDLIRFRRIMTGCLGGEHEVIAHAERLEEELSRGTVLTTAERIPLLKNSLESLQRQEYFRLLSEFCRELSAAGSGQDVNAMELYYSISVLLLRYINQNRLNDRIDAEMGTHRLMHAEEHASWTAAGQYLFAVSAAVFRLMDREDTQLSERALQRVNAYIENNLDGDLSLTALADVGGFNVSYLSRLYKQVYKQNVSEFIFQKRMELAAQLLTTTTLKINDVSVRIGYVSAHSFSRAFRSWSGGLAPMEYRTRYRK